MKRGDIKKGQDIRTITMIEKKGGEVREDVTQNSNTKHGLIMNCFEIIDIIEFSLD